MFQILHPYTDIYMPGPAEMKNEPGDVDDESLFTIFSALASPGVELLGSGGGSYGFLCFSLVLQLLHGES